MISGKKFLKEKLDRLEYLRDVLIYVKSINKKKAEQEIRELIADIKEINKGMRNVKSKQSKG